jgi:alpha-1,2-mannosyltransferase
VPWPPESASWSPGPVLDVLAGQPGGGVSGSPFFTNQDLPGRAGPRRDRWAPRTALWLLLSAALLAIALPVIRRADAPLALMATAGVALLVSPTSWSHHWVWIAPALLVMAATAVRERSPTWAVALVLTTAVFVLARTSGCPARGTSSWAGAPRPGHRQHLRVVHGAAVRRRRCYVARRPQPVEVPGAP